MNVEFLSRGWALIAEGASMISLAYASIEQPGAAVVSSPSGTVAPAETPPLKPQVDRGLSLCPVHGVSWTVKEGGISKNGKPYKAFWKCAEKDGDAFCNEKPQKIWADTHPADRAA